MLLNRNFQTNNCIVENVVLWSLIFLLPNGEKSAILAALSCIQAWLAALSSFRANFSITLLYPVPTPTTLRISSNFTPAPVFYQISNSVEENWILGH